MSIVVGVTTIKISNTKLYVPIVNLSNKDNGKTGKTIRKRI